MALFTIVLTAGALILVIADEIIDREPYDKLLRWSKYTLGFLSLCSALITAHIDNIDRTVLDAAFDKLNSVSDQAAALVDSTDSATSRLEILNTHIRKQSRDISVLESLSVDLDHSILESKQATIDATELGIQTKNRLIQVEEYASTIDDSIYLTSPLVRSKLIITAEAGISGPFAEFIHDYANSPDFDHLSSMVPHPHRIFPRYLSAGSFYPSAIVAAERHRRLIDTESLNSSSAPQIHMCVLSGFNILWEQVNDAFDATASAYTSARNSTRPLGNTRLLSWSLTYNNCPTDTHSISDFAWRSGGYQRLINGTFIKLEIPSLIKFVSTKQLINVDISILFQVGNDISIFEPDRDLTDILKYVDGNDMRPSDATRASLYILSSDSSMVLIRGAAGRWLSGSDYID